MKIQDLKPEYKKLAIANQIAQGNEPNEELYLENLRSMGNFDWDKTPEGNQFWYNIYSTKGQTHELPGYDLIQEYISQPEIPQSEVVNNSQSITDTEAITVLQGRLEAQKAVIPQWISVEKKLPEIGVEVTGYSPKWVDEDYNPNGKRICFLDAFGWWSARWNNTHDCYDTLNEEESERNIPTHWIPLPQSPVSLNNIKE